MNCESLVSLSTCIPAGRPVNFSTCQLFNLSTNPVIAIFDIGKTNKKLVLFDEHYKPVYEESRQLEEIPDEDGFMGEDLQALTNWVKNSFDKLSGDPRYDIRAVNFAGYGASFVCLDEKNKPVGPLYNYLKPFPAPILESFFKKYGDEKLLNQQAASPTLGNLNSGLHLYRLKYEKPELFAQIKHALHLPQYLSFILSQKTCSEITSVGCHTFLWDFNQQHYHDWVLKEGLHEILPGVHYAGDPIGYIKDIPVGTGLHDSSSALIPYLFSFHEPFILLSTGTWCISLNPFNQSPLTDHELQRDCLCYLSFEGKPVKASRLFAGYEFEQQVKRLAEYFKKPGDYHTGVTYKHDLADRVFPVNRSFLKNETVAMIGPSGFAGRDLSNFSNYEDAYYQLVADIIAQQVSSTQLVIEGTGVKKLFVDGGFSQNSVYMHLLAFAFPGMKVYSAVMPQASALGAAMVIHKHWNTKPLPLAVIDLKLYSST